MMKNSKISIVLFMVACFLILAALMVAGSHFADSHKKTNDAALERLEVGK